MAYGVYALSYDEIISPKMTLREYAVSLLVRVLRAWYWFIRLFVEHPTRFCVRYWGVVFVSWTCSFIATSVAILAVFNAVV